MKWNDFNITGIPTVDFVFNLILKLIFMILIVIMMIRAVSDYKKGAIAQVMVTVIVGLVLAAGIFGFSNTVNLVNGLTDVFKSAPTGGSGGGSGV
ncbi:hypothetical protein [Paenibacillus sp. 1A_MP2]|uniref:hypothetical protein n=1 Tax=Paenibacillus sp. 1A_MP2 TaxID=3457495 RepID=UPI003FCE94F7